MNVIQSFVFSISRVRLSLYEQRILVKIVERAQESLRGRSLGQSVYMCKVKKGPLPHNLDNVLIELPARYLLDADNQHYEYVYDAARSLMRRTFEYYDKDKKVWYSSPLIYNVSVVNRSGTVRFYVARSLFDAILDFRMGYSAFDLSTALQLPSVASIRLYCLLCSQSQPLTWSISTLRRMFEISDDAYPHPSDFIRRVIEPARCALNAANVESFTYAKNIEGRKIAGLTFFPYLSPAVKARRAEQSGIGKEDRGDDALAKCIAVLSRYGHFTAKEIAANQVTIKRFCKHLPEPHQLLYDYVRKSSGSKVRNPKGYIVASMRTEVAEAVARSSSSAAAAEP